MTRQPLTRSDRYLLSVSAGIAVVAGLASWFAIWIFSATDSASSSDDGIAPVRPAAWFDRLTWLPPAAVCGLIVAAAVFAVGAGYVMYGRGRR